LKKNLKTSFATHPTPREQEKKQTVEREIVKTKPTGRTSLPDTCVKHTERKEDYKLKKRLSVEYQTKGQNRN